MKPIHVVTLACCFFIIVSIGCMELGGARNAARRMSCSNNFKQLGLAIHNYHSVYKQIPPGAGGTGYGTNQSNGNQGQLSGLVALLPFMEQQALWEQIANPYPQANPQFPAMGPAPWHDATAYPPFATTVPTLNCPSDASTDSGTTNYAFCYGDAVECVGMSPYQITAMLGRENAAEADAPGELTEAKRISNCSQRGMFMSNKRLRFREILDGLSNTIAMGEIARDTQPSRNINGWVIKNVKNLIQSPRACEQAAGSASTIAPAATLWPETRGYRWADGRIRSTGMMTVLAPNSASCTTPRSEHEGVFNTASHHTGGAHVLMGDGAVLFMTDSIDNGNRAAPSVHRAGTAEAAPGAKSPYGLWGALGTRASKEDITLGL